MLTPEEINRIRKSAGRPPLSTSSSTSLVDQIKMKSLEGNQFDVSEKKSFLEKTRDFAVDVVGGEKLAEGAGMGIAAPEIQKNLTQVEQDASDIELALTKRIIEQKKAGKDVAKLESALANIKDNQASLRDTQSDFVEALPTNKEVIGSSVRLAGSALAPSIAKGAAGLTGAGAATTLTGGLVRGVGAGALAGGVEGAIQGAGIAAEDNRSTEEIVLGGLVGAGAGAAFGGAIGGVTGAVSGGIKASKIKKESFYEKLVAPKETADIRRQAIEQGRFTESGIFKKSEIVSSKRDKELAKVVKDVVDPKASMKQNVDSIKGKITEIDNGAQEYIKTNKVPFNSNQLRSKLDAGNEDLKLIFASDSNAEKTYKAVVKAFMDTVDTKDTSGLFSARKNFDQIPAVKKLLENDKLGENARKEIVLSVRRAANDYIAELLPDGNEYKVWMQKESKLFEALGNIADKYQSNLGQNEIQILTKEYPIMKWVIGALGTGAVGAAGVGVGSAIIGSTD